MAAESGVGAGRIEVGVMDEHVDGQMCPREKARAAESA